MDIIFGKHDGCDKEFVWEVSYNLADYIHKDDVLLVETTRGLAIATATTDVVSGDGAKDIAERNKAYLPLKKVITFANSKLRDYISKQACDRVIKAIKNIKDDIDINQLPF
jgi:hypothetical protein